MILYLYTDLLAYASGDRSLIPALYDVFSPILEHFKSLNMTFKYNMLMSSAKHPGITAIRMHALKLAASYLCPLSCSRMNIMSIR